MANVPWRDAPLVRDGMLTSLDGDDGSADQPSLSNHPMKDEDDDNNGNGDND